MKMQIVLGCTVAGVLQGSSIVAAQAPATAPATAQAASAPAAADVATDTPATQPAPLDPKWQALLTQFSSEDFRQREAAQKQLDAVTWRDRDLLKRLAGMTQDAEAKARIQDRIDAIAQELAVNPPPLTLDLKDAPLDQVAAALAGQMDTKVEAWPQGGGGRRGVNFTLKLQEKRFWEMVLELNKQHPVSLQQGYDGLRLMSGEPGLRNGVIVESLAVFPTSITRSKNVNLQKPPGDQVAPETLQFSFTAGLDPRVQVVKFTQPELIEVIDDAGNELYKRDERRNAHFGNVSQQRLWSTSVSLKLPENIGKKIVSAKGEMRFVVGLAEQQMELTDIDKKLKQPIAFAGQQVVFDQLEIRAGSVHFQMSRKQGAVARIAGAVKGEEAPPLRVAFIDTATGTRIWSTYLQGGHGGNVGGNVKGPLKVELSLATKTKEMVLPFELKDLPLP